MTPILIVQHHPNEGPGYLASVLQRHQLPYRVLEVAQEPLPPKLGDIPALVSMGGPMSANDDLPWISQEIRLIREAASRGIPVLGHCLGGQLISKALGGVVTRNPVPEIGWHDVHVQTETGPDWLKQLPPCFLGFHWHGDTFSLPVGARRIFSNHFCQNQGFILGSLYALQCHVEMTQDLVRQWVADNPQDLQQPSASVQTATEMTTDLSARVTQLQAVADVIYTAWLAQLGSSGFIHKTL